MQQNDAASGISTENDALAQKAIAAALTANWQEAIKLNEKIIESQKTDVEALNRLARALLCQGQSQKAQKFYKKVLEIDPYNIIAIKNLEKLSKCINGETNGHGYQNGNTNGVNLSKVFLDEPGKTKLVSLLNLAPPSILASLNCGDVVILNPKNHSIAASSQNGTYLGAFPDDLAHRLIAFIAGGNQYDSYVKSASPKNLTILVRETLRSSAFGNQPTFATKTSLFEDEAKPR